MKLIKANEEHISELVRISKEAFDSDVSVGAAKADGPLGYDDISWHICMMKEGCLFTAFHDDKIVGGAVLFPYKNDNSCMYVGRIFVNPCNFKKGYGIAIMEQIEKMYPDVSTWMLDTPAWNVRTNRFYKKLGYEEVGREGKFIYYKKTM